ncbi:MAG: NAD(P)/FAD-dependent oxidoreductase [Eubacterium sp.]
MYDLVIIGGGAAGLTAAIYAARAGLDFVVLEQDGWGGGQITSAHTVENYPGVSNISGADLGEAIKEQAVSLGAKIELGIVNEVKDNGEYKQIVLHNGEIINSKAVIAATGANPRKLGVTGEQELLGRGVSYCAVCDGAFFAGKDVFVIGGGDTAVEDAIYLSSICKSVTLVHRRDTFRAPKTRTDILYKLSNVTIRCNENLNAITGEQRVDGVELTGAEGQKHYNADGVFIAVGTVPATAYLNNLPLELDDGYIVAGEDCKTSVSGLFVAGDIRKKPLRQVVTAVADGANAATGAIEYLKEKLC